MKRLPPRRPLPRAGDGRGQAGAAPARSFRSRRLFLPGVIVASAYFAVAGGDHSVLDARRAEDELAARRAEIREVRRQIDSMRARIAGLREDDELLERFARERYGFIRDGEYLYRISEPEPAAEEDAPDRRSILGWLLRNNDEM